MLRKVLASLAAAAVFATTFSPVDAAAQRHGYYERDHRDYGRGRRHHHRDRDDGDAVAAGVVGLILGVTIASLASQPRDQRSQQPYYGGRDQRGYDPRYDDRSGSAYESDYGDSGAYYEDDRPCLRREERWDNASGGYITVVTPC